MHTVHTYIHTAAGRVTSWNINVTSGHTTSSKEQGGEVVSPAGYSDFVGD